MASQKCITDSYRSDIVLLSGLLNGYQESKSWSHPKNKTLTFLSHISTVLTIGNTAARYAENVHTVTGSVDDSAINCLVFAENVGPCKDKKLIPQLKVPGECEEKEFVPTAEAGERLLRNHWSDNLK